MFIPNNRFSAFSGVIIASMLHMLQVISKVLVFIVIFIILMAVIKIPTVYACGFSFCGTGGGCPAGSECVEREHPGGCSVSSCEGVGRSGGGFAYCPAGTYVDWSNPYYYCGAGMDVVWEKAVGCCELTCEGEYCEGPDCDPDNAPECWCPQYKAYRQVGTCTTICSATAPTNLAYSTANQTLSWTAGTGGTSQTLYVSEDPNQIANNCTLTTSPGCIVNDINAVSPYSLSGVISPGTVYYSKVTNYSSSSCSSSTASTPFLSSCSFGSASINVAVGDTAVLSSTINASSLITTVNYSSTDLGIASVTSPDTTHPYSTTVSGVTIGSVTVTSNVYFGATLACTAAAGVNVVSPDPWWQVMDGDVSSNGDLISSVADGAFFGLPGAGGYPGVAAYGGSTNLTTANVSVAGWLVNSAVTAARVYNYDYFINQIPTDITAGMNTVDTADVPASLNSGTASHDTNNYYWYKYNGALTGQPLTIPAVDIGTRKIILLVDNADVNITGNINLSDGQGFFMLLVKGSINVDPTVGGGAGANLEGLYFADINFSDGVGSVPLWLRGSLVVNGSTNMQRDLAATLNSTPSEFFEYAPDQILLFPKILGTRRINWKEVAP